jgi:hypothetical protein
MAWLAWHRVCIDLHNIVNNLNLIKMPLEITSTREEKVHVKLAPATAAGNPATLDGPASFTIVSGDATVVVDADGLGAFIVSGDGVGDSIINIDADADLGAGVRTISDTITYHVTDAEAAALGLTAEPAVPK